MLHGISRESRTPAMDTASALSRIFPGLPRTLIRRLADVSGMQHIGKGSLLFCEGERAHFVYALVEGRVSLISGPQGEESIADFMDAGDVILIAPSLLDLPYMVTAKAVTELLVIMIPSNDFRRMTETELPLAVAVNRLLAKHWRLLLRHLTQTKFRGADSRLTQYLLDNAGTRAGPARLVLQGTKQDLAAHLGVTPATLSRSLRRLRRVGVKTSRSEIEIENVSRLSMAAGYQENS
jgi:CRP-like cAMP-binding protein